MTNQLNKPVVDGEDELREKVLSFVLTAMESESQLAHLYHSSENRSDHDWSSWVEKYYEDGINDIITLFQAREKEAERRGRIDERKAVALDNYQGQTFSDSTNWEGKFRKFIDNNERRLRQLSQSEKGERS